MKILQSVSSSTYDQRNRKVSQTISNPSLSQVFGVLDCVDGSACSEMSVTASDGRRMIIGGGPEGYIVTVIGDDFGPYELVGDADLTGTCALVIGGVMTTLPAKFVANREQVDDAIRAFCLDGTLAASQTWELD